MFIIYIAVVIFLFGALAMTIYTDHIDGKFDATKWAQWDLTAIAVLSIGILLWPIILLIGGYMLIKQDLNQANKMIAVFDNALTWIYEKSDEYVTALKYFLSKARRYIAEKIAAEK